jgi:hypothetical protein
MHVITTTLSMGLIRTLANQHLMLVGQDIGAKMSLATMQRIRNKKPISSPTIDGEMIKQKRKMTKPFPGMPEAFNTGNGAT